MTAPGNGGGATAPGNGGATPARGTGGATPARGTGGGRWIALVVALLLGNAGAGALLVVRSSAAAPSVIPDYYRRAVTWDEQARQRRTSDALGWRLAATLTPVGPARARLAVTLTGRDGAPVDGAALTAEVRHRSRATGVSPSLAAVAPGRYEAELPVDTVGLHDVAVTATRGGDAYSGEVTVELGAPR